MGMWLSSKYHVPININKVQLSFNVARSLMSSYINIHFFQQLNRKYEYKKNSEDDNAQRTDIYYTCTS